MTKFKIVLFLVFITLNIIVYLITELNRDQRIKVELDNNLNDLKTHYEILLYNQKLTADATYISTLKLTPKFIEIFTQAQDATEEKRDLLREELVEILSKKYRVLQMQGVLQYQFVFPDNTSFLRMHKLKKYGDDLSDVRADFVFTNRTHKAIRGFTQGRTSHAFRNVYPIKDKKGNYLGAMEISFSSDDFQKYLTKISKIHTHFLVNKHIFESNTWKRDDLILKYVASAEHSDYMLTMNSEHTIKKCVLNNSKMLKNMKKKINRKIKIGDAFALYIEIPFGIKTVSFLPIKGIKSSKALAWLVSYEDSDFIYKTIIGGYLVQGTFFILFVAIFYLIYRQKKIGKIIELDNRFVNDVLNSTDDIMFATNFKKVTFSNRKFRSFFNVSDENDFNEEVKYDVSNIFLPIDGYLHKGLFNKNETIPHFLARIAQEKRIVTILDSNLNKKVFNINVTKTSQSAEGIFLVTLSDITKQKEHESIIHKKAYLDGLTGVYNRNKFDEAAHKELRRDARYKRNLSMAIIDIDHFKNFNDSYGHLIGDEVLILLAQHLNSGVRDTDIFARWGGEEFVILFPETNKNEAEQICNKLRQDIKKIEHSLFDEITASFGITQYIDGDTIDSLFKRCDEALYKAKETGRNRVCVI